MYVEESAFIFAAVHAAVTIATKRHFSNARPVEFCLRGNGRHHMSSYRQQKPPAQAVTLRSHCDLPADHAVIATDLEPGDQLVLTFAALRNSRYQLELNWNGRRTVRTSTRSGIGYP
jgi:hypothetical protein